MNTYQNEIKENKKSLRVKITQKKEFEMKVTQEEDFEEIIRMMTEMKVAELEISRDISKITKTRKQK